MVLKKEWEPANTAMKVLVHLPASQIPKKRHILCAHTQGGWGDPMWTVNPIVLLIRIASVLGLWTSFHQWSLLRKQCQKCSQNPCVKNGPNLGSSLFCWV
jgi:Fe-S-cluster-containing dehydrogenase component